MSETRARRRIRQAVGAEVVTSDESLSERVDRIAERQRLKARGCRCSLIDRDPGCPLHGEDVDQWKGTRDG